MHGIFNYPYVAECPWEYHRQQRYLHAGVVCNDIAHHLAWVGCWTVTVVRSGWMEKVMGLLVCRLYFALGPHRDA